MLRREVVGALLAAALMAWRPAAGAPPRSASMPAPAPAPGALLEQMRAQVSGSPAAAGPTPGSPNGSTGEPAGAGDAAAQAAVRSVTDRFESTLVSAMRGRESQAFPARYDQLAPAIRDTYDLPYIGQLVLSRSWDGLAEAQRQTFLETFERLVVSTFAAEVGAYSGQVFKFDSVKPLRRGRMLVRSQLVALDGDVDRFDYTLREIDGGWRIINVSVGGVSDLALKRAEYGGVIESEGFAALLERMRAQIRGYEEKP